MDKLTDAQRDIELAHFFGDDLKASETDIENLLNQWAFQCKQFIGHGLYVEIGRQFFGPMGGWKNVSQELRGKSMYYVAWLLREGQPYQAALEAVIFGYRRTPPAFSTDYAAMGLLTEQMRKWGYSMHNRVNAPHDLILGWDSDCTCECYFDEIQGLRSGAHYGFTEPEARAKAAHAKLTHRQKEGLPLDVSKPSLAYMASQNA